jgi:ABC-2 type transport system ATP-binding protein
MIEAINLCKDYGQVKALRLSHLKINESEKFGLVGNNGAGKTTFFSLILDLIEPTDGQVKIREKNAKGSEHWKIYTGSYLDERFLIDFLTPEEYFSFIAKIYKMPKSDYDEFEERFEDFFNDEILRKKKYIREFSKGNQKKIGLAASMMMKPELLVLDEPFPHLDPTTVYRLKNMLNSFNDRYKTTILISSHDLNHVTEVCGRIGILEKGQIIEDLPTDENTLPKLKDYFAV